LPQEAGGDSTRPREGLVPLTAAEQVRDGEALAGLGQARSYAFLLVERDGVVVPSTIQSAEELSALGGVALAGFGLFLLNYSDADRYARFRR
jgi:hypothetical protein